MNKRTFRSARPTARLQEGRTDWFRMQNNAMTGIGEVYIYDEIGYFGVGASDFVAALAQFRGQALDIHINSPGGDVYDGIAIHTAIQGHGSPTTAYIDGLAASAASFIAMGVDNVVIARPAEMMIHDAMGLTIGNAADHRAMVEDLDRVSDNIAGIYAAKAGGTAADWRERMLAETWYTAEEAVQAGLADSILGADPEESATNTFDMRVFAYARRSEAPAPVPVEQPEAFIFDPDLFRAAFREAVE